MASTLPPAGLGAAPPAGAAAALLAGDGVAADVPLFSRVRGTPTPKLALGSSGTLEGSTLALLM